MGTEDLVAREVSRDHSRVRSCLVNVALGGLLAFERLAFPADYERLRSIARREVVAAG